MQKFIIAILVLVSFLLWSAPSRAALTVTLPLTPLNILWRVQVPRSGGVDYMTTTASSERNAFTSDGQIFYVPRNNDTVTAPLYRLFQSLIPNHMESETQNEGGYSLEGTLGYPWSTTAFPAPQGLTQIMRMYNPANQDHATTKPGEVLPVTGYTQSQGFSKWGFARYNNLDDDNNLLSLTAGGVTVASNRNAGGCVWQWTYRGVPYIDHYDYGREMQSAFFYNDDSGTLNNPTECGDGYSQRTLAPQDRHGSPMVSGYNFGSTQSTRSAPLEWYSSSLDPDHPIVYPNVQLGKDLLMNFNGMGPVVRYKTYLKTAFNIDLNQQNALYIPTIYVLPNFTKYYKFDAGLNIITPTTLACNNGTESYLPASGYGGVIIADNAEQNAMGLFGQGANTGSPAGDVDIFKIVNNICLAPPTASFSVLSAAYKRLLPGAGRFYTTYVMSGTLTEVKQYMLSLKCQLAGCDKPLGTVTK